MWDYYKRTFIPTQVLIAAVALALILHWKQPALVVLAFVLVMEAASFGGAAWANRIRRKILASQGLTLDERR